MSSIALFLQLIIGLGFALLISSFLNAGKIAIGLCLTVFALIFGICYIFIFQNEPKILEKGEYYSTQCQIIETNIDNGFFQSNTNRLKCGDVIENVTVDDYQSVIEAYQNSNDKLNISTQGDESIEVKNK